MKYALIRPAQGSRHTREQIAQLLAKFLSSGLSQSAFARANGISQPTLSYWLRTRRPQGEGEAEDIHRLVPVKITEDGESFLSASRFELDLPGGLRLGIPVDFDERALARLLPILAGLC
jgi:transcriptional regulator with XRE-family HTH domain